MDKLLKLLGKDAYEMLKSKLGDAFESFVAMFNTADDSSDSETKETEKADVEADVEVETEAEAESTEAEAEVETEAEAESTEADVESTEAEVLVSKSDVILADGTIDLSKITDPQLRQYAMWANEEHQRLLREVIISYAIRTEATQLGAIDVDDIIKFIDVNTLSVQDGVAIGVSDALASLKKQKPYLFKDVTNSDGFNPAGKNKPTAYVPGMSWDEAKLIRK